MSLAFRNASIADLCSSFPDRDSAMVAFSIFDRDDNGDATRDEFEMATMQLHREKLALEASMRDLDGAVRRLDDILMVIVFVIACLIFATMLSSKISTFVRPSVVRGNQANSCVTRSHPQARSSSVSPGLSVRLCKRFSVPASSFSSSTPLMSETA